MEIENPLKAVYDNIWSLVEQNQNLASLVREGNRIKYDRRMSAKGEIISADLPELALFLTGGTTNLHHTSSSSQFVRVYQWAMSTGESDMNVSFHDVSFELLKSMTDWKRLLAPLTFKGATFVKDFNIADISEGLTDAELNRAIQGWSSIWNVQVTLYLRTKDLLPIIA